MHEFPMLPDDAEVERRMAASREKLINPEFDAFREFIGIDVPNALRTLYSDLDLTTSRNISLGPLIVRSFDPLVTPFHILTDDSDRRFFSFACGDDGESYAVLLDPMQPSSRLYAIWDDGIPDDLELTLDEILASRGH